MKHEIKVQILKLLIEIDGLARDSRGNYENARGNDSCCYEATEKIRKLLEDEPS